MIVASLSEKLAKVRWFIAAQGLRAFLAFILQRTFGRYWLRLFRRASQEQLRAWIERKPPGARCYIVWSTLDWRYPYRQRPQHFAKALAELGHPVVFITPSTGHDRVLTTDQVAENVILVPSIDVALEIVERPVLVILSTDTRWTETHLDAVKAKGGSVVYDYLDALDDSLSVSPITAERRALHDRLLRDETGVVVTSVADCLDAEVAEVRTRHHAVVTNGVDLEPFLAARRGDNLRRDFASIVAKGRPIIGYYGSLAAWFDYALMLKLARERPHYEIVTIGPDLDGSSKAFADRPENLHVLPGMNYVDLPRHGCWFDVCLVPFVINDITLATSPLKIFEYMAMQSPIVSTPMPECRKYGSILIGEHPADFIDKVDAALARRGDPAHQRQLLGEARANAWPSKAADVAVLVDALGLIRPPRFEVGALEMA